MFLNKEINTTTKKKKTGKKSKLPNIQSVNDTKTYLFVPGLVQEQTSKMEETRKKHGNIQNRIWFPVHRLNATNVRR